LVRAIYKSANAPLSISYNGREISVNLDGNDDPIEKETEVNNEIISMLNELWNE
jgi:hypothetical protein